VQEVVPPSECVAVYSHVAVPGMVVVVAECWPMLGESAGKGLGYQDSRVVLQIGC